MELKEENVSATIRRHILHTGSLPGNSSRMANAMLEEHNKPARIHAPTGAMDHLTLMGEA